MEWQGTGIILSSRRHGEGSAVLSVLTREKGVHSGLLRGGWSRRQRPAIEPGNTVHVRWRGRLAEHLGSYSVEMVHPFGAGLMDDPVGLAAMISALSLSEGALPERESHPAAHDGLMALLDALSSGSGQGVDEIGRLGAYVKWELGLLGELGYGLDFSECAATGEVENLVYVSPRSGRAVSKAAGQEYVDVLLPLPGFLKTTGGVPAGLDEVLAGLKLTGYFLERHVFSQGGQHLPSSRGRLVQKIAKKSRNR